MGFARQEYWSGLPFPSPGDLPDPGIEPVSPALEDRFFFFLTTEPLGKPNPGMTIQLTSFFFNQQNSEEYFKIFFTTQIFVAIIAGGFHSFSQKQFFENTYIAFFSYSHSTVIC